MKISIEISLYPLAQTEFKDEIWSFIQQLRKNSAIEVQTNGMSTQVFGDYKSTLQFVTEQIADFHHRNQTSVFVLKIISGDRQRPEKEPER